MPATETMDETLPPANYDEAAVGPVTLAPLTDAQGRAIADPATRAACREAWLGRFADELYGPIPAAPDAIEVERTPLPDQDCERLTLTVRVQNRTFRVDAALWLPRDRKGPVPVVVALDFLGPAGTLYSDAFPLDPKAAVSARPSLGMHDQRLGEHVRGATSYRWPTPLIADAGWGLLTSCYGSWVPDNADEWTTHGVWPLLDLDAAQSKPRAISLWAWALSRLVDVAQTLPEIDASRIAAAGHSRLGKVALWAGANDERITDILANDSGCGGASLSSRCYGETLEHMRIRFPHWTLPADSIKTYPQAFDQHHLMACVAPRRLYIASAVEDLWCDPRGEFLALRAAAPLWRIDADVAPLPDIEEIWQPGQRLNAGPVGWHLRHGGHDLMPWDWRGFLDFLGASGPARN